MEARRLIATGGVDALTMRGLAAGAGVAVNTVYALMGRSRDAILEAVIDDGLRDLDRELVDFEVVDAVELGRACAALVDYVIARDEIYRPLFLAEAHRARNGAHRWGDERALRIGRDILIAGVESGVIDPEIEIELLAQHMLSVFRGETFRWAASEVDAPELRARYLYAVHLALVAASTEKYRDDLRAQLVAAEQALSRINTRRSRRRRPRPLLRSQG